MHEGRKRAAVIAVNGVLASHAGKIEWIELEDQGREDRITVSFRGMCQGCAIRQLTWLKTVEPMLRALGLEPVLQGGRLSSAVASRLQYYQDAKSVGIGGTDRPGK